MFSSEPGYQIKTVSDATSSNNSEEVIIPEDKRPAGFIIYTAKDAGVKTSSLEDNDTDKDGVVNKKDRCPDTPKGKVVDEFGCMKLIRLHVNFDFDKYNLKDEYKDEIDTAVKFVEQNPNLSVSIDGHTDSDGSIAYNQKLSEKRARTVSDRLRELGVERGKLVVKGFGELKPLVPNTSSSNKAKNRRVDISFNR
jgi:OOP family OmpA-OmpF porin